MSFWNRLILWNFGMFETFWTSCVLVEFLEPVRSSEFDFAYVMKNLFRHDGLITHHTFAT